MIELLDWAIEQFEIMRKRRLFRKRVLTYKKKFADEQRKVNHTPFALPEPRHQHNNKMKQ